MTCCEFSDLLYDHLEGGLSRHRRATVALHLLLCGACRSYVASYRATIRLARSCADTEVDAQRLESIVQALLAAPRSAD